MPKAKRQQRLTETYHQEKKTITKSFKTKDAVASKKPRRISAVERFEEDMKVLKEFDLTWQFGPCTGITRLERWERANRHGLNPPASIKELISDHENDQNYLMCLWKDYDL